MLFSHLIDIDECSSNPCENGGTCNDAVDMYTCDCDAGYNGDNCETSKFSVILHKMKKDVKVDELFSYSSGSLREEPSHCVVSFTSVRVVPHGT